LNNDATAFTLSFVKDEQALRDAKLPELADEINKCAQDFKDALESGEYNNIFTGKKNGTKALNECKDKLASGLSQVEKIKAQEAAQKIADAQTAADTKATADVANREDQQAFQAGEAQKSRDFQQQQQQQQQDYQAQNNQAQWQADYNAQATATETSQGSTLTFGLLNTGGATEFVDKDKASQVYYGKNYDELTPEQQMLLNLLKGKGGN
jgi:FKBP-type peptidyl-prolyl cis-trans isomerase